MITALAGTIPDGVLFELRRRVDRIVQSDLDYDTQWKAIGSRAVHTFNPEDTIKIQRLADRVFGDGPARPYYQLGRILGDWSLLLQEQPICVLDASEFTAALARIPPSITVQSPTLRSLAGQDWSHPDTIAVIRQICAGDNVEGYGLDYALLRVARRLATEMEEIRETHQPMQVEYDKALVETSWASRPRLPAAESDYSHCAFKRTGRSWKIRFRGGDAFSISDRVGIRYISILMQCRRKSFEPKELLTLRMQAKADTSLQTFRGAAQFSETMSAHEAVLGDGAEQYADSKAIQDARARREELTLLRDSARVAGDQSPMAGIEQELEEINNYLAEVTSPQGQGKVWRKELKRDQNSVRKAIRQAIEQLREFDAALGQHLRNSIHFTDGFQYRPESEIDWEF